MPDEPQTISSVEGLQQLFVDMTDAVSKAQRDLDGKLQRDYLASCETVGQALVYSIPRTSVEMKFGLQIKKETKKFLFFFSKKSAETQKHTLKFSLIAVPDPPQAVEVTNARDTPFHLLQPNFLLSHREETQRYDELKIALANSNRRQLMFQPDNEFNPQKEIAEIEKALADEVSERGMVCFRLDDTTPAFLIVRVTGKSQRDSIFILRTENGKVEIYSFEGDGNDEVDYRPLHSLAVTIRRWLQGATPLTETVDRKMLEKLGLESLPDLAENLRAGYVGGIKILAEQKVDSEPPVLYDLTDVSAELSYTVDYSSIDKAPFNFEKADDNEFSFIQNRALIQLERTSQGVRTEIELAAPEFVLSGDARDSLLSDFNSQEKDESLEKLLKAFWKKYGKESNESETSFKLRYKNFIQNKSYRRNVVALLSYKGDKPKEEFLVILQGLDRQNRAKDFVFVYKKKDKEIKPIMALDEEISKVVLFTPLDLENSNVESDFDLEKEAYQAFHNFFHAVIMWRIRTSRK